MVAPVASKKKKRRGTKRGLAQITGARRAPEPGFIEFCDPTLSEKAPSGTEWIHEIKSDGYRAQAHLRANGVTVFSRNGYDWTRQFAAIAKPLGKLGRTAVLDGEAVVIGEHGIADYQALRRELSKTGTSRLAYHAFDILYLDGFDLRDVPLLERKRLLAELLKDAPAQISFVDYIEADGETVFEHACRLGAEGIVSKRKDSRYNSGRRDAWIKRKCTKSDDFRLSHSSRSLAPNLGASPHSILGATRAIACSMRARRRAAIRCPRHRKCARFSIRLSASARRYLCR
jgi:bifunctional non-homologous end joining protein LigD